MPAIEFVEKETHLYKARHSLAHVLAQAVLRLYPDAKLAFGPPIEDGFYYDFLFSKPLGDDDLPAIETEMRRIIAEDQAFVHFDLPIAAAIERLRSMDQPFKSDYAQELAHTRNLDELSFYENGPFLDLCEGPHIRNTAELKSVAFHLRGVSGAYWRGDERNAMLTRIYAYAFNTAKDLKAHIAALEAAKQRDHRKLATQLGIFTISEEVGKGLPLWLPNGTAIRQELEKLAHEMEFKSGYQSVATPNIARRNLYVTSGHIPLYEESMFPAMHLADEAGSETEDPYYLKPMNCPHHHMIFAAEPRSYRDLPLRLSEYGTVYRYERAGELQGLTRVRGMCMNDAHIYVAPEDLKTEFKAVMALHKAYYDLFGFKNYFIRLSLWDPEDPKRRGKYVDNPEAWAYSESMVRDALDELNLDYHLVKGEAAFYGPKVDFQFRSVIGKEFTLSTNQLDFAVPSRFNLHFTDREGKAQTPFVIHRAPLGTHERFIAFLLEHYGGAFPTWLAPVQVRVVPVSEAFMLYADELRDVLRDSLIRVEVDGSSETMGKRMRNAITSKAPIVVVLGAREMEARSVTVRRYGSELQESMSMESFITMLKSEIQERRLVTSSPA